MSQAKASNCEAKATTVVRKSDHEVVVTRIFDSPAAEVYAAWTRPELFREWWAPRSMGATITACEIDARRGGGYSITFGADGADPMTFFGRYLEVAPASRLAWTNEESPDAPVTTVTFEAEGDGTRLSLRELYPTAEPVADAVEGLQTMMVEQFAQLDALLDARRPAA